MTSHQLWLYVQDLHKIKTSKNPSIDETTSPTEELDGEFFFFNVWTLVDSKLQWIVAPHIHISNTSWTLGYFLKCVLAIEPILSAEPALKL